MSDQPKLTDEQLKVIGEKYTNLLEATQQQLIEYRMWLKANIQARVTDAGYRDQLLEEVDQVKLVSVRPEEIVKDTEGKATLSYVYDFPDMLHAWLELDGNEKFNLTLQGGVVVPDVQMLEVRRG